jgi:hypothetical protein
MPYSYRIVNCKNCGVPIDQGDCRQIKTSGDVVRFSMSAPIELSCPACGTLGTYTDEDLKPEMRDHPPDTQPS